MDVDPAAIEAAAKAIGLYPCSPWSTCSGGDNPTREEMDCAELRCPEDQCTNPECITRVPCSNPWHRFAAAVSIVARATADAIADKIEAAAKSDAEILAPRPARLGGNLMNPLNSGQPMTTMENRMYVNGVVRGKEHAVLIARSFDQSRTPETETTEDGQR